MKTNHFLILSIFAAVALFGCNREQREQPTGTKVVATISQSDLASAVAAMYATWEETTVIPNTLNVGGKDLTLPQYQYAMCKFLVDLKAGKKSDIDVLNFKAAEHPDRDSYDLAVIAVMNGPANSIESGATEDICDIARRMIAAMESNGQVPNQTLFMRSEAVAFCTNRATVTMARVIAEYAKGNLPSSVSTEYLSASATLKGWAQQFVTYLDVWEKTVGTVSADGTHCSDNGTAWENVHFIPIPHSGGVYADGKDQYADEYKPYYTITVDGVTYDAAQCWVIATRGFLDLVTKEGSSLAQTERNGFVHTLGNGAKFSEPIPSVPEWGIWGNYPWYEKADDPAPINLSETQPCTIDFLVHLIPWWLTRSEQLGKIGNFQTFGDSSSTLIFGGYSGNICPMRAFLILARFYKYLLDNNINENIYDAVKDLKIDYDLYGVEMPDIEIVGKTIELSAAGTAVEISFSAKKDWTATPSESWIHVDPANGNAGNISIAISADANTGDAREGTVLVKGGNVTEGVAITVKQSAYVAPTGASLKDFAEEFVKGLDVWNATVGTVESESMHLIEKGTAWENVHFIPVGKTGGSYDDHEGNQHDAKWPVWTLNIKDTEYTSSQAWEIAIRGLMNMITKEGEEFLSTMDDRNKAYTLADNAAFTTASMPNPSANNKWGNYPWYESDASYSGLTYNGQPVTEVDANFMVKVGSWHVVRGLIKTGGNPNPLNAIGNFQQFGTSSSTLILEGYEGLICPMRELLVLMRIYNYLLNNNIDTNVYTAIKDQKFDFDLYNQQNKP